MNVYYSFLIFLSAICMIACNTEKVKSVESPFLDRISFYSEEINHDASEYSEVNILPLFNHTDSFILITSDTCMIRYHRDGDLFLEEKALIKNIPMPNFIIPPSDSVLFAIHPILSNEFTHTSFSKEMGSTRKRITLADSVEFVFSSTKSKIVFIHDSISYYNCLWPPSYDCIEKEKLNKLYEPYSLKRNRESKKPD